MLYDFVHQSMSSGQRWLSAPDFGHHVLDTLDGYFTCCGASNLPLAIGVKRLCMCCVELEVFRPQWSQCLNTAKAPVEHVKVKVGPSLVFEFRLQVSIKQQQFSTDITYQVAIIKMEASPFQKLLPELRNRVYELALVHDRPIQVSPNTTPEGQIKIRGKLKDEYHLTTLLQTCKQIRSETTELFYAQNTFNVSWPEYPDIPRNELRAFKEFTTQLGDSNSKALSEIKVTIQRCYSEQRSTTGHPRDLELSDGCMGALCTMFRLHSFVAIAGRRLSCGLKVKVDFSWAELDRWTPPVIEPVTFELDMHPDRIVSSCKSVAQSMRQMLAVSTIDGGTSVVKTFLRHLRFVSKLRM